MKITSFPKCISKELAEETGWHIGDGTMNYYTNKWYKSQKGLYQLRGHIEDDKPHYINRIKPIFKFLYNIEISLREMPSTRVFGFQIWSNDLTKFKESLGLKPGPKLNVKIPEIFLQNKDLKIAVLRGIFDTDGCVYLEKKKKKLYPRIEISTISKKLIEQLLRAYEELGLRANFWNQKIRKNKKQAYTVRICGNTMFEKFMQIISPQNPKHINKYNFFKESFKNPLSPNNI